MKNENKTQKAFKETGEKLAKADPEFTEIVTNFIQGEVVQASRLTEKERLLCILSVLLGCQGMGNLEICCILRWMPKLSLLLLKRFSIRQWHILALEGFTTF